MGAHLHGTAEDRHLEGPARACENILLREGAFCARGLRDRLLQRALDNAAAVDDARLVEMDMRLDEPWGNEKSVYPLDGSCFIEAGLYCRNQAVADADVHQPVRLAGDARSGKDQV